MNRILAIAAALSMAVSMTVTTPAVSLADEVPQETVDKIVALLKEMQCEMDTDDIEAEDGGYELDDVFCADGQYDIDLDADLNVTNRRKE